ncbi:MAG TPA: hypothetical protein VFG11_00525 [Acidobacteriota bacterium]|nr:hypothetical protein [Acidobacteriota bacterium]
MTDLERVTTLFKRLELPFFVSELKDGGGELRSSLLHCRDSSEHPHTDGQVIWEFNNNGGFVGELRNGVLIARKFAELFPEIMDDKKQA